MIRFAWLQSRSQALIAAALLAALAVAAAITGVQLSRLYDTLIAHCRTSCDLAANQFRSHDTFMDHGLDILARAFPALIGVFWGAPLLARELETGTYRVAWTQSVTRARWVVTKLSVGGLATAALSGLLTLTITWWYRAPDKVNTSPYQVFDRRDVVPIAYALFAFAAGALVGVLVRRTVPAMAATLAVFVVGRVATAIWIRPHLLPPVHKTMSLQGAGPSAPVHLGIGSANGGPLQLFAQGDGPKNSWTLSSQLVNGSGHPASSAQVTAFLHQYCPDFVLPTSAPPPGPGITHAQAPDAGSACLAQVAKTFHLVVTYQPANRYWTFQWLEAGIFLALALASSAACYWWVTRRTR